MSYIFPRTVGIILLVLSIVYLAFSLFDKEKKAFFRNVDQQKVFVMGFGLIGYVALIVLLGFLFASMIYIGTTTLYLQRGEKNKTFRQKITHAVIFAVLISVFFYVLFKYVFLIQLPSSMFLQ